MATSSSIPATPPSLIELPVELLRKIVQFVDESDESSLIVGPDLASLVLTHRCFLGPAETLLAKHQEYIDAYRDVVIDARSEPSSYQDAALLQNLACLNIASSSAGENFRMTFKSPLKMLFSMHKDKAIANYVRSLVYLAPAEGSDKALTCSRTARKRFGSHEMAEDLNRQLSATMKDILPEGVDAWEEECWRQNLWEKDCGEGITLLLHSLPRLTSLSLLGDKRYLTVKKSYRIHDQQVSTRFRSSIRRLVLWDITSVFAESDDLPAMFPCLQEVEIHCTSPKLRWFGFRETSSFLYFPSIKIIGYQQNPVCLAVAITSGSDSRWTRLECTFNVQTKGLFKFIENYREAFTSPRFERPFFSKTSNGGIKMIITAKETACDHSKDDDQSKDNERFYRRTSDLELRIAGIHRLLESQPIPEDFLKALIEHNQTCYINYEVKRDRRPQGHLTLRLPACMTRCRYVDRNIWEIANHMRQYHWRLGP